MRIALDLDGVIVDGTQYLPESEKNIEAYRTLAPYDGDTVEIFNQLVETHRVYIITARHYPWAAAEILHWLDKWNIKVPAGILTYIEPHIKPSIASKLEVSLFVDDHPTTYNSALYQGGILNVGLMNNPGWPENLAISTPNRISSWKELRERIYNIERSNNR